MTKEHADDEAPAELDRLLETPDLAEALENDRFKQFLDHLPIAIAVSKLSPTERIVYANAEFRELVGVDDNWPNNSGWDVLPGATNGSSSIQLGDAVIESTDFLGAYTISRDGTDAATVNVWSNVIEDDDGAEAFRLVALIGSIETETDTDEARRELQEKDTQLRELQHRVKNNLQMITALIRMEARKAKCPEDHASFDRLAGRVESLALLYQSLTSDQDGEVDLGAYLSQIGSAAMQAQAEEGIRLETAMDSWQVSLNVAMPTGLVVNELLTNALKYAFVGRDSGTISLRCLVDDTSCTVVVSDDGVGMPEAVKWPEPGKLSALIVRSLRENAHAQLNVESGNGAGTTVTIKFTRAAAEVA